MLVGLVALAACGSDEKKDPTNAVANPKSEEHAEEADQPVASVPAAPITPFDFTMPAFAPHYPGSTLQAANSATAGGMSNHEVRLITTNGADRIIALYREKFTAAGMRKTSEFLSGGSGIMSAIGKGRKASIAITKEQGHNAVIVTYSGS
jgi:hypothetical protein